MPAVLTNRHRSFFIALAAGLAVGGATLLFAARYAVTLGANAFFVTYLVLTFSAARKLSAKFLREHAAEEDEPAPLILLVMLAAVVASSIALFLAIGQGQPSMPLPLILGVTSVVLGWFASHTMWALHYAFEYYAAAPDQGKRGKPRAGLAFPGGEDPDGVAFFYFAYVIGMTAQTSDTEVTSNGMRRLVLFHGIYSFFFNTVLVAAAVNIAVSLGS